MSGMKLITRDTDYAVRILSAIALRKGRCATAADLASELDIPLSFVRKILQVLGKRGPLDSYKGKGGGFELSCPPEKILLLDLMNMFQGPVCFSECLFKKKMCHNRSTCSMRKVILELEESVTKRLKGVTLASLMR
jgi:Rrf2 family protein